MRAVVISKPGGPEVLQLVGKPDPIPGPQQALIDVRAIGVNRGDLAQRQGTYPAAPGELADVPGLEVAGTVRAVGSGAESFRPGDRVFALLAGGGYAERAVVHEQMLLPIPDNLDFVQAAALPEVFYTAYDALFNQAGLMANQSVLIHAVGSGVGTAALQLARQLGATTYGTAGSDEKLVKAKELGLDTGINYRREDFQKVIQTKTGGQGVNVILDLVGASYWEQNLHSLSTLGRMVLIGVVSGVDVQLKLSQIMSKRLRIFGTVLRSRPLEEKIILTLQFKTQVLPLLTGGQVKPVVDRVFSLERVAEAHAYMEANLNFGKVVLTL